MIGSAGSGKTDNSIPWEDAINTYTPSSFHVCILWFDGLICIQSQSHVLFQDALTGFSLDLVHLDGHKVTVSRDKVTWAGARVRKKGEGMPNFENNNLHGNLYVTFDIDFPKQDFSDEEKEGKEFFSLMFTL